MDIQKNIKATSPSIRTSTETRRGARARSTRAPARTRRSTARVPRIKRKTGSVTALISRPAKTRSVGMETRSVRSTEIKTSTGMRRSRRIRIRIGSIRAPKIRIEITNTAALKTKKGIRIGKARIRIKRRIEKGAIRTGKRTSINTAPQRTRSDTVAPRISTGIRIRREASIIPALKTRTGRIRRSENQTRAAMVIYFSFFFNFLIENFLK